MRQVKVVLGDDNICRSILMTKCVGVTKSGKQCIRQASTGTSTCWQHGSSNLPIVGPMGAKLVKPKPGTPILKRPTASPSSDIILGFKACQIPISLTKYRLVLPFIYAAIIRKFSGLACLYVNEDFRRSVALIKTHWQSWNFVIRVNAGNIATHDTIVVRYKSKLPCKFQIFPFTIYKYNSSGVVNAAHAIMTMYNHKFNILEIYDPNGNVGFITRSVIQQIQEVIKNITKSDKINYAYIKPHIYGIQSFQHDDVKKYGFAPDDPIGYCSAWSIWLVYLRLTYVNEDSDAVLMRLDDKISKIGPTPIIRGFVKQGLELWKEYGLDFGGTSSKEYVLLRTPDAIKLNTAWNALFTDPVDIEIPKKYDLTPSELFVQMAESKMATTAIMDELDNDKYIALLEDSPFVFDVGIKTGRQEFLFEFVERYGGCMSFPLYYDTATYATAKMQTVADALQHKCLALIHSRGY